MWETTGEAFFYSFFCTGGSVFWSDTTTSQWWICFLQKHSLWLLKMLTNGLEWCGSLVDYCDVVISCLDSHSDGTHSLQSIHWWASDAMLQFSKSDEEKNSSTSWVTRGCAHFQQTFIFGWTIPLTLCNNVKGHEWLMTKFWVLKFTGCFYSTMNSYMSKYQRNFDCSVHGPFNKLITMN